MVQTADTQLAPCPKYVVVQLLQLTLDTATSLQCDGTD